jgi:hypothetical protein
MIFPLLTAAQGTEPNRFILVTRKEESSVRFMNMHVSVLTIVDWTGL